MSYKQLMTELGTYIGDTNNDIPDGQGTMIFNNGCTYEGLWSKGKLHGDVDCLLGSARLSIKIKNNIPVKVLSISGIEHAHSLRLLMPDNQAYFLYFKKDRSIAFQGRFLPELGCKFREFHMINPPNSSVSYFGIIHPNGLPSRYAEAYSPNLYYVGGMVMLMPMGKGRFVFDDLTFHGFIKTMIPNGKGKISYGNIKLKGYFEKIFLSSFEIMYKRHHIKYRANDCSLEFINHMTSMEFSEFKIEFANLKNKMKLFSMALKSFCGLILDYAASLPDHFGILSIPSKMLKEMNFSSGFKYLGSIFEIPSTLIEKCTFENDKKISDNFDTGNYKGEMSNGTKNGKGICIYSNNERYEGLWAHNRYEGFGKYYYKDDSIYIGEFKESKKHGFGTFVSSDGRKFQGLWAKDKLVSLLLVKKNLTSYQTKPETQTYFFKMMT